MTARPFALGCLLVPIAATAAAPSFTHQGRVLDGLGVPLEGTFDLHVGLYDDPTGAGDCWERTYPSTPLQQGYYAVEVIGLDDTGRALADVPETCRWLEITVVGQGVLGPRQHVADYPFGGAAEPLSAPIPAVSTLDGTPRAVGLLSGAAALSFGWTAGGIHTADSGSNTFLGFTADTATRPGQTLLDYTALGNGATYTAPAGTDRYLLVYIANQNGSQSGHNVTGVSFAGSAMTNLASLGTTGIVGGVDSGGFYLYGAPLGTGADTSGAITATFDGAGSATIHAHTLAHVDQVTPVAHTYASGHSATWVPTVSRGGLFHGTELEAYGTYAGQNTEGFVDTVGALEHAPITAPGRTIRVYKSSTANWSGYLVMVALRPSGSASTASANVQVSGTVGGFTGLTPGAMYYLSQSEGGGIDTVPVGQPIGVATSATDLFLLPR